MSRHRNSPRALKRSLNYLGWSLTGDSTVYLLAVRSCSSGNSYEENMGIILKESSGTITTPGFPQGYNYSLIAECSWKILAPAGNVVRVDFISFSLAKYDYVTIADALPGWNLDQSIRLSGQKASFTVFSMGNELSINVFSLYGTSGPGFVANFTSVPTGKNPTQSKDHCQGDGISETYVETDIFSRLSVDSYMYYLYDQTNVFRSFSPKVDSPDSSSLRRSRFTRCAFVVR